MVPEETTTFGDQDKLDFEAESTKTSSSTATGTLYWSIGDNCKPRHYVHGDNFHIFCQRFVQYATLNKFTTFLDVRFLSLFDNRTHSKLLDAKISDEDKSCPHKLVAAYGKAMNLQFSDGDIMSALFAIEQKSGETIDDLIYRINLTTDKSCNLTDAVIEKSKIAALCNAVKDQSIKTELRKNRNLNWKDAVEIVQIMDKPVKSCDHEVNFINIHSRNGDETVRGANQLKSAGEEDIDLTSTSLQEDQKDREIFSSSNVSFLKLHIAMFVVNVIIRQNTVIIGFKIGLLIDNSHFLGTTLALVIETSLRQNLVIRGNLAASRCAICIM